MNSHPLQAVILAAGESSRFWPLNSKHKSLLRIMGKPLIWHTINGLAKNGIKEIIIVQGPQRDIENELDGLPLGVENVRYVVQPEANGMSGAMMAAKPYVSGQFFVVFAHAVDCQEVIRQMIEKSQKTTAKTVLAGQETKDPWLYGVVRLEEDRFYEVIEKPAQGKEPSNIKLNGVYLFDDKYFDYLQKVLGTVHFNEEFEVALSKYASENDARIIVLDKNYQGISLKYPWHLFKVQKYLFENLLTKKQIPGSAQIAKNATIEGNVVMGENVKVFEGAVIKGPCYLGDNTVIGNNSIVRDYCDLEADALVGALCEVGRTIFQANVHVHSGFIGDSILDRGVRIGAGTITTNVRIDRGELSVLVKKESQGVKKIDKVATGLKSLGVIVGQNTKVGARATFMPGRFIGKNCLVGPAALVMHNIDDGTTTSEA